VVGLVDVSQTIREMLALLNVSVSKHALLEVRMCCNFGEGRLIA
jgi:hypothetical protein